jgi:hypothetical protein
VLAITEVKLTGTPVTVVRGETVSVLVVGKSTGEIFAKNVRAKPPATVVAYVPVVTGNELFGVEPPK